MSVVSIKAALEIALNAMTPAMQTEWPNVTFSATANVPFQSVGFLFAEPRNAEMGSRHQELGYMQVRLMYPLLPTSGAGIALQMARAELIRTTFKRGNTFASGGITVLVTGTPEIAPGMIDGDRYSMPVRIRFMAQIN